MKLLTVLGLLVASALADRPTTTSSETGKSISSNGKEKRTTAYSVYGPPLPHANGNSWYAVPVQASLLSSYGTPTYSPSVEYSAPSAYTLASPYAVAAHGPYAIAAPYGAAPVTTAVPANNYAAVPATYYAAVSQPLFYPSSHTLNAHPSGYATGYAYPMPVRVYSQLNGVTMSNYPPAGNNLPSPNYAPYQRPSSGGYSTNADGTRLGPVTFGPGHGGAYTSPAFVPPTYVAASSYESSSSSFEKPSSSYAPSSSSPLVPAYETSSFKHPYSPTISPAPSSSYKSESSPSYSIPSSYSPTYSSSSAPGRPSYIAPPSFYGTSSPPPTYGPPSPSSYSFSPNYSLHSSPSGSPESDSSLSENAYNTIRYSSPTDCYGNGFICRRKE